MPAAINEELVNSMPAKAHQQGQAGYHWLTSAKSIGQDAAHKVSGHGTKPKQKE